MWPPTRSMVGTLINIRGLSSVGRALPLQGRCQEFESPRLHNFESLCATPYSCRGRLAGLDGTIACIPPTPTSHCEGTSAHR